MKISENQVVTAFKRYLRANCLKAKLQEESAIIFEKRLDATEKFNTIMMQYEAQFS